MKLLAAPFTWRGFSLYRLHAPPYIESMSGKGNGSNRNGNGHDKEDDSDVVHFPTLAERDRMRKQKEVEEKALRKQYRKQQKAAAEPFLNVGKIPPFAGLLVASFLLLHIPTLFLDPHTVLWLRHSFGFIPGKFTGTVAWDWMALLSPLTHMFLHAGWMHVFFNSVMGLALGMYFEKMWGTRAAVVFFFLCGLAGAAVYTLLDPFSRTMVIGASGGISGLFGALLLMLSQQRRMGALSRYGGWPIVCAWALLMILIGVIGGSHLAWQAHIGGLFAGAGLFTLLQKGKIRL